MMTAYDGNPFTGPTLAQQQQWLIDDVNASPRSPWPAEVAHLPVCPHRNLPVPFINEVAPDGTGLFAILDYGQAEGVPGRPSLRDVRPADGMVDRVRRRPGVPGPRRGLHRAADP